MRAILTSPTVGSPNDGRLLVPVVTFTDEAGALWIGTERTIGGRVAEVVDLPAARLVAVTTANDGQMLEIYLLDAGEWVVMKQEARPLAGFTPGVEPDDDSLSWLGDAWNAHA